MNETGRKPVVTAKNIIRVLSVIVTIIFFCPTFLVSCSGQTIDVSAMNVVGGIKSYGESAGRSFLSQELANHLVVSSATTAGSEGEDHC